MESMEDILILSVYDGGYQASIKYKNRIYNLTALEQVPCDILEDEYKPIYNKFIYCYVNMIKEGNWTYNSRDAVYYLFDVLEDVKTIIVCEDGKIDMFNGSDM